MSELLKWKDKKNRKPLLLEGARQVGKTYLLKDFGKRYFKNVAYINFQNPSVELIDLFNGSIDPKRILKMLVGKVNKFKLEPMDFEEFLWANNRENIVKNVCPIFVKRHTIRP